MSRASGISRSRFRSLYQPLGRYYISSVVARSKNRSFDTYVTKGYQSFWKDLCCLRSSGYEVIPYRKVILRCIKVHIKFNSSNNNCVSNTQEHCGNIIAVECNEFIHVRFPLSCCVHTHSWLCTESSCTWIEVSWSKDDEALNYCRRNNNPRWYQVFSILMN